MLIETPVSFVYKVRKQLIDMNTWQEGRKLVELRTKTDRQLAELATRILEAAACLARAPEYHSRAQRAWEEARRLLPLLHRNDRRRCEARLEEIGDMLHPQAHAACF